MSGYCYWYDCETTGLDPCRDQIVQFAGQRTDEDLNPLGQGQIFYCRLSEERLPALDACLTTGITPQVLEGQTRCTASASWRSWWSRRWRGPAPWPWPDTTACALTTSLCAICCIATFTTPTSASGKTATAGGTS